MHHLVFAILIQAASLQEPSLSPPTVSMKGPLGVTISRGYFEKQNGKWVEDHRNELERAMYDANGKLIGVIEVGLLDTALKYNYTEDSEGRVTETTISTPTSVQTKHRVAYNAAGQIQGAELVDGSGDILERASYVYSKRGKLAEAQFFGKVVKTEGLPLVWKATYSYSADGKQIKRTTYRMHPKERIASVAVLNEQGDMQSLVEYDEWGAVDKEFVFEYDRNAAGFWTKMLKFKKLSAEEKVPVDAFYRTVKEIRKN